MTKNITGILKDTQDLLRVAKGLSKWIIGDKYDSLRVDCMNELGIYTTTVEVGSKFSKWVKKIGPKSKEFSMNQVYDVKLAALKPPIKIDSAISYKNDKIIVDLTKTLEYDMFRLEVSYRIDKDWLRSLVSSRSSPEPLAEKFKYHLSAQLTNPESLQKGFSEVDVEEFPVEASVQIQEDIKLNIPSYVKQLSEIEAEMLSEYDPHKGLKILRLQQKRHTLKKKMGKEDLMTKLRDLTVFLRPTKFLRYLDVLEDFRLHKCEWGSSLFRTMGMFILPKTMEVISRTDLNLNVPAKKGVLIYESGKFSQDVDELFK